MRKRMKEFGAKRAHRLKSAVKKIKRARPEPLPDIFNRQIEAAVAAAELANEVASKEAEPAESRRPMKSLRHEAHDASGELLTTMAAAITVPLEREDLFRASQSVETAISDLRDLVREMTWWELEGGGWSKDALAPAIDSLKELSAGVEDPDADASEKHFRKAKKHAAELRRAYQRGLTAIFSDDLTMTTLKKREILRRIDFLGLHLSNAADAMLAGMIKRYM